MAGWRKGLGGSDGGGGTELDWGVAYCDGYGGRPWGGLGDVE